MIDSISSSFQKAGYLGYLPLSLNNMLVVSFFFTIGTAPIIYKYCEKSGFLEKITLWISTVSFGLIISKYIGLFGMVFGGYLLQKKISGLSDDIVQNLFIFLGVSISTYILLIIFSYITIIKLYRKHKYILAMTGGFLAILFSTIFGGLEFVGTWGGNPIFKMISLIARNSSMSLILLLVSIKFSGQNNKY